MIALRVHASPITPETAHTWRIHLAIAPGYQDDETAVYATLPVAGKDHAIANQLSEGLGLILTAITRHRGLDGPALDLEAVWGMSSFPMVDSKAQVLLLSAEGGGEEVFDLRDLSSLAPEDLVHRYHCAEYPHHTHRV